MFPISKTLSACNGIVILGNENRNSTLNFLIEVHINVSGFNRFIAFYGILHSSGPLFWKISRHQLSISSFISVFISINDFFPRTIFPFIKKVGVPVTSLSFLAACC